MFLHSSYQYNYGNYYNNASAGTQRCAWCHEAFSQTNAGVAIVSVEVPANHNICMRCWKAAEEHATATPGGAQSKDVELGNLKNLLTFAARYVQVCNEGGDWDIIDKDIAISADTLARIRAALGLKETHDFTKR